MRRAHHRSRLPFRQPIRVYRSHVGRIIGQHRHVVAGLRVLRDPFVVPMLQHRRVSVNLHCVSLPSIEPVGPMAAKRRAKTPFRLNHVHPYLVGVLAERLVRHLGATSLNPYAGLVVRGRVRVLLNDSYEYALRVKSSLKQRLDCACTPVISVRSYADKYRWLPVHEGSNLVHIHTLRNMELWWWGDYIEGALPQHRSLSGGRLSYLSTFADLILSIPGYHDTAALVSSLVARRDGRL
mmetsp:Transcript_4737/g.7522  ORF Transcript_4737/g.7522 Transcript_4737/m.7522 type:complete len:238 (+) Transcript_4737:753-1466(+)